MTSIHRFEGEESSVVFSDPETGFTAEILHRAGPVVETITSDGNLLVVLRRGRAVVTVGDTAHELGEQEAITLPAGTSYEWRQSSDTLVFMAGQRGPDVAAPADAQPESLQPSRIGPTVDCPLPARHLLKGAIPVQNIRVALRDTTGQWSAGYWDSTGYYRITQPFSKHEFMLILTGSLSLTVPGEDAQVFGPGEAMVLPQGTVCDWDTPSMSKIYSSFVSSSR